MYLLILSASKKLHCPLRCPQAGRSAADSHAGPPRLPLAPREAGAAVPPPPPREPRRNRGQNLRALLDNLKENEGVSRIFESHLRCLGCTQL